MSSFSSNSNNSLQYIYETDYSNEEILEMLSIYCSKDTFEYSDIIKLLASKYDMRIETNPLEIQILSLRTMFNKDALKKFYSVTQFVLLNGPKSYYL